MGYQDIFKRYELKYLISKRQKELVLDTISSFMEEDQYGKSTICNIYYDTPEHILIKRSLDRPIYKEKLRVRSYGVAASDGEVFVELKKKYNGIVYKRRAMMTQQEAEGYLAGKMKAPYESQITQEIDYFLSFYKGIAPAMHLTYEREAYQGKQEPDLRVTFDENILWREEEMSLTKGIHGTKLLSEDQVLMELKVANAIPLPLAELMSQEQIYKSSFSKYGAAYLVGESGMSESVDFEIA